MATSMQFDTLNYAKKLEKAGVPAAQAEAQSELLADVLGKAVASPGDLVALEKTLVNAIQTSELKIQNKLATVGGDITLLKWMSTTAIGLSIMMLLKLFLH